MVVNKKEENREGENCAIIDTDVVSGLNPVKILNNFVFSLLR